MKCKSFTYLPKNNAQLDVCTIISTISKLGGRHTTILCSTMFV